MILLKELTIIRLSIKSNPNIQQRYAKRGSSPYGVHF